MMRWLAYGIAGVLLVFFGFLNLQLMKRFRFWISIPAVLVTMPTAGIAFVLILMQITTPITRHLGKPNLASSLQLSAPDLASFAIELMDPMFLSREARDLMFEKEVDVTDDVAWANGIGIDTSDGHTTYWHWGSNPGFQSLFVIEPKTGNGIVVLTNTGGFLDFVSRRKGGYNMSKDLARQFLEIDGAWDVRGRR